MLPRYDRPISSLASVDGDLDLDLEPLDAGGQECWRRTRQVRQHDDGPEGESVGQSNGTGVASRSRIVRLEKRGSVRPRVGAMYALQPPPSLEELRAQEARARRTVRNASVALRVQQALRFQREADRLFMLPAAAGFRDGANFDFDCVHSECFGTAIVCC